MEIQITNEGILLKSPKAVFQLTKVLEKAINLMEWDSIKEPTISQVSEFAGVSTRKIKNDLTNIDCPLRKTYDGGKGRNNEMRFFKSTVVHYKKWLNEK